MKRGLVLGGGGVVGLGYHAGALKALSEYGIDPGASEVIVGTSAGAIVAGYLGAGYSPERFYADARRDDGREQPRASRREKLFKPLWTSTPDRARRTAAALFVTASSRGLWRPGLRGTVPAARWTRSFRVGLYSSEASRRRFRADLPADWPRAHLYLSAADLYTGKRVLFHADGTPSVPFPDAVLASMAIPGFFPPVKLAGRLYVDGGVVSSTSLDVAVEAGCTAVICIAPLSYEATGAPPAKHPKMWPGMAYRSIFSRTFRRELAGAAERSVHVLVVRPGLEELKLQGSNSMRHHNSGAVARAAREATLRMLEANAGHPSLEELQDPIRAQ
jgi:NTE family protein